MKDYTIIKELLRDKLGWNHSKLAAHENTIKNILCVLAETPEEITLAGALQELNEKLQKERFVDLYVNYYLQDEHKQFWLEDNRVDEYLKPAAEKIADYLLQNGVIVPPCKVGDEVYCIKSWKLLPNRIRKEKVYRIDYEESKGCIALTYKGVYFEGEYFHTKAEAEHALKERDGK